MMNIEIHGTFDRAFGQVRENFAENFATRDEVGAAVSVVVEGKTVVDLWAGHADAERTRPWERDTLVKVHSVTKGVVAIIAHRLAERGALDLDAPVAKYWPQFAQAGKEELPVRYLLSHQAGLPAVEAMLPPGSTTNWELMVDTLAALAPLWPPGEKIVYHATTYGWLVGEVIRRVSGKTVGQLIREEIAAPLGVDFELGMGPEHDSRTADIGEPPAPTEGVRCLVARIMEDLTSVLTRAFLPAIPAPEYGDNTRVMRAAEIPASNGHTNARALARIYAALLAKPEGGVQLLGTEALTRATEVQTTDVDEVMQTQAHVGLGLFRPLPEPSHGVGPAAFGHMGYGGSLSLADPDADLGFGYVMNRLHKGFFEPFVTPVPAWHESPTPDRRAQSLLEAAYRCL